MKKVALIYITFLIYNPAFSQSDQIIANVQKMMQLFQQGAYEDLLDVSQQTLGEAEKEFGQQHPLTAVILSLTALAEHEMGDAVKAEKDYLAALTILKKNITGPEFKVFLGTINSGLGRIEMDKGNYEKSEKYLNESEVILRNSVGTFDLNYANTINDLGNLFKAKGDYGKSESYLLQSADIRKKVAGEKSTIYGVSLNNLGSLFEEVGDYEKSATYYEGAIRVWKETIGMQHPLMANVTNNFAGLFVKHAAYEKAIEIFTIALNITEKVYGTKHEKYITTLSNMANVYLLMDKIDEAESLALKAYEVRKAEATSNQLDYAFSSNNLGLVKLKKGLFNESARYLSEALNIFSKTLGPNHKYTATCTNNLGVVYDKKGDSEKATLYLKQSLDKTLDRIDYVFPTINDKDKTSFYATVQKDFEYFTYFATKNYNKKSSLAGDLYNYTIATKALLLNTSNKIKKRILTSGDDGLIALYQEWRMKKNSLAQVWQMSSEEKLKSGINESVLESEVSNLEKKLSSTSEIFATANDKTRYTWKDIQKKLKPGEAAIEIIRFRKYHNEFSDTASYAAVIVKPNGSLPEMVIFQDGNFLEKRIAILYKNSIHNAILDPRNYNALWAPIAEKITGIKKVFLSPDGVYNQVNLNSLYNPSTKKYLIEELEIQQVTNTKDVLVLPSKANLRNAIMLGFPDYKNHPVDRNQNNNIDDVNINADSVKRAFTNAVISPLPGTLVEITSIADVFKSKNIETQMVSGVRANESFLKKVESPSVLHIATHGFFLADVPRETEEGRGGFIGFEASKVDEHPLLRSGILLAGAEQTFAGKKTATEDGVLSAYEAMTLNLDETELVVLSACETGLGEIKNGEGVYGFQRALIIAGAKSVIMSLWKVNDQVTQQLMVEFYKNLLNNKTKREAFIMAQNQIRAEHPEPYYWAPFIMIGD